MPPHTAVREADGTTWASPYPVIMTFWPKAFAQVCILLPADETAYYCNVIAPPVYHPRRESVEFADLDLDVRVGRGQVELVDQAEFHARKGAYPADWVDEAERAAQRLMQWARDAYGVFSPATARRWRAWLERRHPF